MFSPERFPHARPKGKDSSPAPPARFSESCGIQMCVSRLPIVPATYSFSLVRFMLYTDII